MLFKMEWEARVVQFTDVPFHPMAYLSLKPGFENNEIKVHQQGCQTGNASIHYIRTSIQR